MELIDIGANLTHESFRSDREAVIARALAAGVVQLLVTGASVEDSAAAVQLARSHPRRLFATAGVHPHHAGQIGPDAWPALRALLAQPEVCAVGECGLDYERALSPPATQRQVFERQLELAAESGKPVFLHQRGAHEDFAAMLRALRPDLSGAVAHCFTGGRSELEEYLQLDLYVGLTGWICDERRGTHLQPLVSLIPAERLLLETDAPYLLPRDLSPRPRTRRNEPVYLPHIAAAVAAARGQSPDDCAAQTTRNARRLFALPPP